MDVTSVRREYSDRVSTTVADEDPPVRQPAHGLHVGERELRRAVQLADPQQRSNLYTPRLVFGPRLRVARDDLDARAVHDRERSAWDLVRVPAGAERTCA